MTAISTERGTGITPFGCALADALQDHQVRAGLSAVRLAEVTPRLGVEWWRGARAGLLEAIDFAEIDIAGQALGLAAGQLLVEAEARTVPIVCPPWCVFDDYSGDGIVCHMSVDHMVSGVVVLVTAATTMGGTFLDDGVTVSVDGQGYSPDELRRLRTVVEFADAQLPAWIEAHQ